MGITDTLHYAGRGIIATTTSIFTRSSKTAAAGSSVTAMTSKAVSSVMPPLWKLAGRNYNFVRIAAVSGAAAVILGALGSHKLTNEKPELKMIFENANRFHFFHTLALMGLPMVKYPLLTGSLMLSGTFLFSGALYYRAFTEDRKFSRYAPMGGALLIFAWLSLIL